MIGTSLVYLAVRINPLNLLVQYSNSLLYSIVIVNRFPITMEYLSGPVFAHNKGYSRRIKLARLSCRNLPHLPSPVETDRIHPSKFPSITTANFNSLEYARGFDEETSDLRYLHQRNSLLMCNCSLK